MRVLINTADKLLFVATHFHLETTSSAHFDTSNDEVTSKAAAVHDISGTFIHVRIDPSNVVAHVRLVQLANYFVTVLA